MIVVFKGWDDREPSLLFASPSSGLRLDVGVDDAMDDQAEDPWRLDAIPASLRPFRLYSGTRQTATLLYGIVATLIAQGIEAREELVEFSARDALDEIQAAGTAEAQALVDEAFQRR